MRQIALIAVLAGLLGLAASQTLAAQPAAASASIIPAVQTADSQSVYQPVRWGGRPYYWGGYRPYYGYNGYGYRPYRSYSHYPYTYSYPYSYGYSYYTPYYYNPPYTAYYYGPRFGVRVY
jgi:hypothetical protein